MKEGSKMEDDGSSKKFLGGAEMARRKAQRRKPATRILRPGETVRQNKDYLSKQMPAMERFFASLLKSPASDFVHHTQEELLGDVCRRLGLSFPSQSIRPRYESRTVHFESRAALVMEESRHVISEALARKWRNKSNNSAGKQRTNSSGGIRVSLQSMQTRKYGVVFVFEKKTGPFTAKESFDIRPGSCFQILPPGPPSLDSVLLACVMSNGRNIAQEARNDESANNHGIISLMVFSSFGENKIPSQNNTVWQIEPVATLISNLRQYEACMNAHQVPFLLALMGHTGATHTRFQNDDDDDDDDDDSLESEGEEKKQEIEQVSELDSSPYFKLPVLNASQERASRAFLQSSTASITLVQGPPGTGKTTLLNSILCRYLTESRKKLGIKRCLMVCAPTNKAVSVLATRYVNSIQNQQHDVPFNAVLIGDQDKLLVEEQESRSSHPRDCNINGDKASFPVRNMFVYTWIDGVVDECKFIRQNLKSGSTAEIENMRTRMFRLCSRIVRSLPCTCAEPKFTTWIRNIRDATSISVDDEEEDPTPSPLELRNWMESLESLSLAMGQLHPDSVVRELLRSADLVFCTLASAGSSVVRSIGEVDDLIVDEAAASTEPELYIPFCLKPRRLLVVGDPMQLPATVLSRSAERLGLSQSLHERLMYDLNWDHIVLDVQYRMKPEISRFPSAQFYKGKIENGDNVTSPMYENNVKLLNGNPYLFLHVDGLEKQGFSGSYCNSGEAKAILQLVQNLKVLSDSNNIAWHSPEKIRIITFYQAQVSLIKRMLIECGLGRIVVATVDSSQGCEADIVIISFVRSNSRGNHSAAGFLADDRRLNVALTRAKYQLICVGNVRGLQNMTGASTLQFLSNNAYERNSVINEEQNNSHKKEGTAIASNPEIIQNQTSKKRRKVN